MSCHVWKYGFSTNGYGVVNGPPNADQWKCSVGSSASSAGRARQSQTRGRTPMRTSAQIPTAAATSTAGYSNVGVRPSSRPAPHRRTFHGRPASSRSMPVSARMKAPPALAAASACPAKMWAEGKRMVPSPQASTETSAIQPRPKRRSR